MSTDSTASSLSTTPLSDEDALQFWRIFGNMPYGGMLGGSGRPKTLGEVMQAMRALSDRLREVAANQDEKEKELRQLQSDVAAVRRVFGIGVASE